MSVIRLYGPLGAQFAREYDLDVRTPAEAVRALCAIVPGFRAAVAALQYGLHIRVGSRYLEGEKQPFEACSSKEVIRLVPATAGSSAGARVAGGVVLMAVGYFGSPYGLGFLVPMGASLALGGVAEMLAKKPSAASGDYAGQRQDGYTFSSGVNTTGQGVGVAINLGARNQVGSHVLSARIVSDEGVLYASLEAMHPPAPTESTDINTQSVADPESSDAMSPEGSTASYSYVGGEEGSWMNPDDWSDMGGWDSV
jgi:predicted phage tail protein